MLFPGRLQAEISLAEAGGHRQGWNLRLCWVFWTKPRTYMFYITESCGFCPQKSAVLLAPPLRG